MNIQDPNSNQAIEPQEESQPDLSIPASSAITTPTDNSQQGTSQQTQPAQQTQSQQPVPDDVNAKQHQGFVKLMTDVYKKYDPKAYSTLQNPDETIGNILDQYGGNYRKAYKDFFVHPESISDSDVDNIAKGYGMIPYPSVIDQNVKGFNQNNIPDSQKEKSQVDYTKSDLGKVGDAIAQGWNSFNAGAARTAAGIANIPQMLSDLAGGALNGKVVDWFNDLTKSYTGDAKYFEDLNKKYHPGEAEGIVDAFNNGHPVTAITNFGSQLAGMTIPLFATMFAPGIYGGASAVVGANALLGGSTYENEEKEANPSINPTLAAQTGIAKGSIDGLIGGVFGVGPLANSIKKTITDYGAKNALPVVQNGIQKFMSDAVQKYPMLSVLGGGLDMASMQIAKNAVDKYSGVDPNKNIGDGVGEAIANGLVLGLGGAGVSAVATKSVLDGASKFIAAKQLTEKLDPIVNKDTGMVHTVTDAEGNGAFVTAQKGDASIIQYEDGTQKTVPTNTLTDIGTFAPKEIIQDQLNKVDQQNTSTSTSLIHNGEQYEIQSVEPDGTVVTNKIDKDGMPAEVVIFSKDQMKDIAKEQPQQQEESIQTNIAPQTEEVPDQTVVQSLGTEINNTSTQDNSNKESDTPSYEFNGVPISRKKAFAMIEMADNPRELNGLKIGNDDKLVNSISDRFPQTHEINGKPVDRETIQEALDLANTDAKLAKIKVENDPELEQAINNKRDEINGVSPTPTEEQVNNEPAPAQHEEVPTNQLPSKETPEIPSQEPEAELQPVSENKTAEEPKQNEQVSEEQQNNSNLTENNAQNENTQQDEDSKTSESITPEQKAIEDAEQDVNTEPTEAQKEAGNYKMGHVKVNGLDITIENPKGSVRSGVDQDGKKWETPMNNTYGYIKGTTGRDGDNVDVFLGNNPSSDKVFVVDQMDPKTGEFDEHKAMVGFDNADQAKEAYLSNYEPDWKGLGNISEVSMDEFKKWLGDGEKKLKPIADNKSIKKENIVEPKKEVIPLTEPTPEEIAKNDPARYRDWVAENSTDPDEINGAYQEEVNTNNPNDNLSPWQKFVLGGKTTQKSFEEYNDPNNITGTLARNWFSKDAHPLDEVAQEATEMNNGKEVTPNEIAEFMVDHPTNYVRKTTDLANNLKRRYKEVTGKSITQHKTNKVNIPEEELVDEPVFKASTKDIQVNDRFNEELEKYKNGAKPSGSLFNLGKPQKILKSAGLQDKEIVMPQRILSSHLEKHGLAVDDIKDLPNAIQDPLMVYEWGDKAKSMIVITEIPHEGNRITAAIKLERNGKKLEINEVASIHNKSIERLIAEMANPKKDDFSRDLLKYVNKEKTLDWLNSPTEAPLASRRSANQELNTAANIIENFKNPTIREENFAFDDENLRDGFDKLKKSAAKDGSDFIINPNISPEKLIPGETLSDHIERKAQEADINYNAAKQEVDNFPGKDITVVRNENQLPKNVQDHITKENKGGILGAFDSESGKIYLVSDNLKGDKDIIQKTITHELVGHKGLRDLLGDKFNNTLNKVYDSIPQDEREQLHHDLETDNRSVVADEYLARRSEDETPPSFVQRAIAEIRKQIRKIFPDLKFSDSEIKNLIKDSRDNLRMSNDRTAYRDNDIPVFKKSEENKTPDQNGKIDLSEKMVKTKKEKFDEAVQDAMLSLKKFQNGVKQLGIKISPEQDAYNRENLYHGRVLNKQTVFVDKYMKPLLNATNDLMKKAVLSSKERMRYMIAKHAPERNAYLREKAISDWRDALDSKIAKVTADKENYSKMRVNELLKRLESKSDQTFKDRLNDKTQKEQDVLKAKLDNWIKDHPNNTPEKFRDYQDKATESMNKKIEDWKNKEEGKSSQKLEEAKAKAILSERNRLAKWKAETESQALTKEKEVREKMKDYVGAGMSDEEANKIVRDVEMKAGANAVNNFWKAVNNSTNFTLQQAREGGKLSDDAYRKIKGIYNYYVPLRGWDDAAEDEYDYRHGLGEYSSALPPKTKGRISESDDPIGYIIKMANSEILSSEKNRIAQAMMNLVTSNRGELKKYVDVTKTWLVKGMRDGKPVVEEWATKPPQEMFDNGDVITVNNAKTLGRRASYQAQEHELPVYQNGNKYIVQFHNADPEIVRNIKRIDRDDELTGTNRVLSQLLGTPTRWLSSMLTARNPAFIFPNMFRDLPRALIYEYSNNNRKVAAQFLKNYGRAHSILLSNSDKLSSQDAQYLKEFNESGAQTGYAHMLSLDKYKKEFEREQRLLANRKNIKNYPLNVWRWGMERMDDLAEWSENSTRLAAYITGRQKGLSVEEAAHEAKESSVNFNRKGRYKFLSSYWAFVNPQIQDVYALAGMSKKNIGKMAGIGMGFMVAGFLNSMLIDQNNTANGVNPYSATSDYLKQNFMIIPMPGTLKKISIPLPQVFRTLWGMGSIGYDIYTRNKTPFNGLKEALGNIPQDISIVDTGGFVKPDGSFSYTPLAPTVVQPLLHLKDNLDYQGKPIYPVPYTSDIAALKANSSMFYKNVNPAAKWISDKLYKLGGGDKEGNKIIFKNGEIKKVPGFMDLNPQAIQYMYESYLGGAGQFTNNIMSTLQGTINATKDLINHKSFTESMQEYDSRDLPVFNRFIRQSNANKYDKPYLDIKKELDNDTGLMSSYEKSGDLDKWSKMMQQYGAPLTEFKNIDTTIKDLNKIYDQVQNTNPEMAKEIQTQKAALEKRIIDIYNTQMNKK